MNCQEAQSHIEDVVDRHLSGGAKRRFDLHLARCATCRARFAAEQREHARWFRAFNDPAWGHEQLPHGFADRLASAVAVAPRRRRLPFGLPRWGRIAAALVLTASLVTFGSWLEGLVTFDSDATTPPDSCTDSVVQTSESSATSIVSTVACVGEANSSEENVITPLQKGTTMRPTVTAAALALGTSTLPVSALQTAAGNSCIIAGSTDRSCATAAYAVAGDLDTRSTSIGYGLPTDSFETRVQTQDYGEPLEYFRTDARGSMIIIR